MMGITAETRRTQGIFRFETPVRANSFAHEILQFKIHDRDSSRYDHQGVTARQCTSAWLMYSLLASDGSRSHGMAANIR
jgi:hypothetical protein